MNLTHLSIKYEKPLFSISTISKYFCICSEHVDDFAEPVILIDLFSLSGGFSNSDSVMGGRHHLKLKMYETFFHKLTEAGAKLIFFNGGFLSQVCYIVSIIFNQLDNLDSITGRISPKSYEKK